MHPTQTQKHKLRTQLLKLECRKSQYTNKDNMGILSILCKAKYTKKNNQENENKPATIRRPGAETKVGGFPLTTMGFKAPPVI